MSRARLLALCLLFASLSGLAQQPVGKVVVAPHDGFKRVGEGSWTARTGSGLAAADGHGVAVNIGVNVG